MWPVRKRFTTRTSYSHREGTEAPGQRSIGSLLRNATFYMLRAPISTARNNSTTAGTLSCRRTLRRLRRGVVQITSYVIGARVTRGLADPCSTAHAWRDVCGAADCRSHAQRFPRRLRISCRDGPVNARIRDSKGVGRDVCSWFLLHGIHETAERARYNKLTRNNTGDVEPRPQTVQAYLGFLFFFFFFDRN